MDQNLPRQFTDRELGLTQPRNRPPIWVMVTLGVLVAIVAVPAFRVGEHLGTLIR